METSDAIIHEMRALGRLDEKSTDKIPRSLQALGLRTYADRIEAALKRKADSIHRAMVIIAGIEMEKSDDPPRLWTALEDAYDALSDAMGTDGDTTADVEEAKATGRHFVVKPSDKSGVTKPLRNCDVGSNKIMSESDFEKAFNLHKVRQCCSMCRYGDDEVGCTCTCSHPYRNDNGKYCETDAPRIIISNTMQNYVCDLFEERTQI